MSQGSGSPHLAALLRLGSASLTHWAELCVSDGQGSESGNARSWRDGESSPGANQDECSPTVPEGPPLLELLDMVWRDEPGSDAPGAPHSSPERSRPADGCSDGLGHHLARPRRTTASLPNPAHRAALQKDVPSTKKPASVERIRRFLDIERRRAARAQSPTVPHREEYCSHSRTSKRAATPTAMIRIFDLGFPEPDIPLPPECETLSPTRVRRIPRRDTLSASAAFLGSSLPRSLARELLTSPGNATVDTAAQVPERQGKYKGSRLFPNPSATVAQPSIFPTSLRIRRAEGHKRRENYANLSRAPRCPVVPAPFIEP